MNGSCLQSITTPKKACKNIEMPPATSGPSRLWTCAGSSRSEDPEGLASSELEAAAGPAVLPSAAQSVGFSEQGVRVTSGKRCRFGRDAYVLPLERPNRTSSGIPTELPTLVIAKRIRSSIENLSMAAIKDVSILKACSSIRFIVSLLKTIVPPGVPKVLTSQISRPGGAPTRCSESDGCMIYGVNEMITEMVLRRLENQGALQENIICSVGGFWFGVWTF
ncbi:unnamed protein product [Prunus brigantina]